MASRAVHVEIVLSLALTNFLMAFSRFTDVCGNVEVIYSDNGSTFQAAAKALPELLKAPELKNALRKRGIKWEFIPPYAPSQAGSWVSMIKQIKLILHRTLDTAAHIPRVMELITFCSNAVRLVNERPITALSEDPRDFTVVTPASLLTPGFDRYSPVGRAHERDHLRRDFKFCVALAERFWEEWVAFYLPLCRKEINGGNLRKTCKLETWFWWAMQRISQIEGTTGWEALQKFFPKCTMGNPLFDELR